MKALALLSTFVLGMCGQPEALVLSPPASLLTCAVEPAAPNISARDGTAATDLARDTAVLGYVLAMRSAWGDCSSKLSGVKRWTEEAGK